MKKHISIAATVLLLISLLSPIPKPISASSIPQSYDISQYLPQLTSHSLSFSTVFAYYFTWLINKKYDKHYSGMEAISEKYIENLPIFKNRTTLGYVAKNPADLYRSIKNTTFIPRGMEQFTEWKYITNIPRSIISLGNIHKLLGDISTGRDIYTIKEKLLERPIIIPIVKTENYINSKAENMPIGSGGNAKYWGYVLIVGYDDNMCGYSIDGKKECGAFKVVDNSPIYQGISGVKFITYQYLKWAFVKESGAYYIDDITLKDTPWLKWKTPYIAMNTKETYTTQLYVQPTIHNVTVQITASGACTVHPTSFQADNATLADVNITPTHEGHCTIKAHSNQSTDILNVWFRPTKDIHLTHENIKSILPSKFLYTGHYLYTTNGAIDLETGIHKNMDMPQIYDGDFLIYGYLPVHGLTIDYSKYPYPLMSSPQRMRILGTAYRNNILAFYTYNAIGTYNTHTGTIKAARLPDSLQRKVKNIAMDDKGNIYLFTDAKILKTHVENLSKWDIVATNLTYGGSIIKAVWFSNTLFIVNTYGDIYKLSNGKMTQVKKDKKPYSTYNLNLLISGNNLFAYDSKTVYIYDPQTDTFTLIGSNLNGVSIYNGVVTTYKDNNIVEIYPQEKSLIAVDNLESSYYTFYSMGTTNNKIFLFKPDSKDIYTISESGIQELIQSNINLGHVTPLFKESQTSSILYINVENTLYRSVDDGKTWQQIETLSNIKQFLVSYRNPQKIYAFSTAYQNKLYLYYSQDGGITWNKSNIPCDSHFINAYIDNEEHITYACKNNGFTSIYKSVNETTFKKEKEIGYDLTNIYPLASNPQHIIGVSTDGWIYYINNQSSKRIFRYLGNIENLISDNAGNIYLLGNDYLIVIKTNGKLKNMYSLPSAYQGYFHPHWLTTFHGNIYVYNGKLWNLPFEDGMYIAANIKDSNTGETIKQILFPIRNNTAVIDIPKEYQIIKVVYPDTTETYDNPIMGLHKTIKTHHEMYIDIYVKPAKYKVHISAEGSGSIDTNSNFYIDAGQSKDIHISASQGYHISKIYVNDRLVFQSDKDTSYTLTIYGNQNYNIHIVFEKNIYTVTVDFSSGGQVKPASTQHVPYGTHLSFTAIADIGYHIKKIVVNGKTIFSSETQDKRSFNIIVEQDTSIYVDFKPTYYHITVNIEGKGRVLPSTDNRIPYAGNLTLSFIPDEGYIIDKVIVDYQNKGAISQYTFTNVNSNHTVEVYFTPKPKYIKLWIGKTDYTTGDKWLSMDVAPFIDPRYSRTMVPLRFIASALDFTVKWDNKSKEVTISKNNQIITIPMAHLTKSSIKINGKIEQIFENDGTVIVNGQTINIADKGMGKALIYHNRTMVPLRFFAEIIGCQISWNGSEKSIEITLTP